MRQPSSLLEGPTQSRGKYGTAVPGWHSPYLPTRGDYGHFFVPPFGPFIFALYRFSRFGKIGLPPFTVFHDLTHPGFKAGQLFTPKRSNMPWAEGPATCTTFPIDYVCMCVCMCVYVCVYVYVYV